MGLFFLITYNLLAPLIAALYLLFFLFSHRRGLLKNLTAELAERLTFNVPSFPARPLWFHAASVGEVKALRKLVPLICERYPSNPVMITTSTSSGRTEALKLTPNAFLLPLDLYPLMRRFISGTDPELLMIAETELWPNLLYAAGRKGVRVIMINARISRRTLDFYRGFAPISRLMFANIAGLAVQSREDFERFAKLLGGTEKLVLTGNIKYDLVDPRPRDRAEIEKFIEMFGWKGKTIFCAGSTHHAEEELLLEAFLKVKKELPDIRLIIAPRHPETAQNTASKLSAKGITAPLWSARAHARPALLEKPAEEKTGGSMELPEQMARVYAGPDCLLIDELGLLADIYYFSDIAFVGGTLDATGGHNVLEPSAFSKPVLFGPNVKNTLEGAQALINMNGGFMVKTADELADKIISLLKDPSALKAAGSASKAALESLQGATQKTLSLMQTYL